MVCIVPIDPSVHWSTVYCIFKEVVATGDTFAYNKDISEDDAKQTWMGEGISCFVALDNSGKVLGSYILRNNFPGHGSHIANCAYMVAGNARGQGVARKMCQHSLEEAKQRGYIAMQYNYVVSTNERAVKLWIDMGFRIIGQSPKGFRHDQLGYVDSFMMYREL